MGPAICKSSKDAVSQSARQPFLTAWATLSKCLFHIKGDVAEAVTMINAFKTSHLRPVASPFHRAKGADKTREEAELQPAAQLCACSALCGPSPHLPLSRQHSCSHRVFFRKRERERERSNLLNWT